MMFLIFKKTIFIIVFNFTKIPTRGGTPPSLRSLIKVPLHFKENRKRHFTDERHSFTVQIETQQTQEQQNNRTQTGEQEQRNNNK